MYWKLWESENLHSPSHPIIIYQHVRKKCSISHLNRISLKRWLLISLILTIISFFYFNELIPNQFRSWIRIPPKVNFYCFRVENKATYFGDYEHLLLSTKAFKNENNLRSDSKILLFVESQYSKLGKQIIEILESLRFKYKVEFSTKDMPLFTYQDKGKFSIIIFENLHKYFKMHRYNKKVLDDYCRQFNIGIIGFPPKIESIDNHKSNSSKHKIANQIITEQLNNYPVNIKSGYKLKDYQLNPSNNVLRITRAGTINLGLVSGNDWFTFEVLSNFTAFTPIAQALTSDFLVDTYPGGYRYSSFGKNQNYSFTTRNFSDYYTNYKAHLLTTVLLDNGSYDSILKIFFGNGFDYWLHKLLFIDSLGYLSQGKLNIPLQRYIQIDIDDIFVGEKGTRMKMADVEALINFQKRLEMFISGFKFNVGFSGKYFHRGYLNENQGDDFMIKHAANFRWFCHTYSHSQAHMTNNVTSIENEMLLNKEFAENNNLPVENEYIVSPHHSGVYPVHEPLYDIWKKVWKVRATSTEEYPHLRPAHLRRGFIHRGVMILPRQTCGLYTHTIFIDKYPGGRDKLEKNIFGGDLFYSFIFNQVNVFMTHQSNYANDRLAPYAFEAVFKFLQCWTNLKLLSLPPVQMAKKYFEIYPEEKDPIWMNPCEDKRHYNIWSPNKSCFQFPRFLIIGPQKTGSTALYTFLSMHPALIPNLPNNQTFEEIQFFNGINYYKGVDWYMSFFPLNNNEKPNATVSINANMTVSHNQRNYFARTPPVYHEESLHFYEKSGTYFDGELVPMRVHSLLPHAKLVVILISPIRRAYSWYQHMKAHNLSVAIDFSFYEVVSLNIKNKESLSQNTIKKLRDLRNRCLNPGLYAIHMERWLSYFPPQQITVIDGDELRLNPILVMDKLQAFLKLEPHIDYHKKLRFDAKKGFFCPVKNETVKCLGKSKGRIYPKMDKLSEKYLHRYYWHSNIALLKLLNRMRMKIPLWLELELSMATKL